MNAGRRIAREIFANAWNERRFDDLGEVFAPGCVFHTSNGPVPHGVDEQIALIEGYRASFPDVHFEILHVVDDGSFVAVHVRMTGTNTGEYSGHAATDRSIVVDEMLVIRLHEGRAAEIWGVFDSYSEQLQLGFI